MSETRPPAPAPSLSKPGISPAVDRAVLRLLARGDRPDSAPAALAELRQLRGLA